jgi:hypothetical protein
MPTVLPGLMVPCIAEAVGQPPVFPLTPFNPCKHSYLEDTANAKICDLSYRKSGFSTGELVGGTVGGLVLGLIISALVASCFFRGRYNKVRRNSSSDSIDQAAYINAQFKRTPETVPHTPGAPGPDIGNNQYLVEPFLPEGPPPPTSPTHNTNPAPPTSAYSNTQSQSDGSASGTQPAHVYVVHHDSGGPPVTVFTGGAGVTELPPSYIGRSEEQITTQPAVGTSNHSFNPADRRPQPGPAPRKSQAGLQ